MLWQELHTIIDYGATPPPVVKADTTQADEQNNFFLRFESDSWQEAAVPARGEETPTKMEQEVRKLFKSVHTRKAVGPNRNSGRVLKSFADQLAPVFTVIFSLSLAQCVIPSCF